MFFITDCDPTKPTPILYKPLGTLRVKYAERFAGKTCKWIIDVSNSSETFIYLIVKEKLFLGYDAQLKITDDNNKFLYSTHSFLSPGVILIGRKYKRIKVKLNFTKNPLVEDLAIHYATNRTTVHIDNIVYPDGLFHLPHLNNIDLGIGTIDLKIILKAKSNIKNFLLSLEYIKLDNGSIAIDKVNKYKPTDTFTDNNQPDIIVLTNRNKVTIEVKLIP